MVGQLRQPTPGKCIQSLLSMNPLSASMNMYILLTVLHMFLFVLFERISSNVKTFYECDVTLPWQLDFWISPISLDRDGHLHCWTMEEK